MSSYQLRRGREHWAMPNPVYDNVYRMETPNQFEAALCRLIVLFDVPQNWVLT